MDLEKALREAKEAADKANARVDKLLAAIDLLQGDDDTAETAEPQPEKAADEPPPPPPKPVERAPGPYDHVKCSACMKTGTMGETFQSTKAGTMVRLLVCRECGNQTYLG